MGLRHVAFRKDGENWKVPNAFYRISIKLILKNEHDELLVMQDIHNLLHELPGGGIDWGETYKDAATRELKEELGVVLLDIDENPITEEYSRHSSGYYAVKVYYRATYTGSPHNNEPERFRNRWISKEDFTSLEMALDEKPIQKHTETLWKN